MAHHRAGLAGGRGGEPGAARPEVLGRTHPAVQRSAILAQFLALHRCAQRTAGWLAVGRAPPASIHRPRCNPPRWCGRYRHQGGGPPVQAQYCRHRAAVSLRLPPGGRALEGRTGHDQGQRRPAGDLSGRLRSAVGAVGWGRHIQSPGHRGGDVGHLHTRRSGRGQENQGESKLHRRQGRSRGAARERADAGGGAGGE